MRCKTFTSISFTSTYCIMPGYGSPSYFTTHHWPTWDSSPAFDLRPGSGILSSSACEGPNSIEVRLKQKQGPAEQKQLRILDCINLDLLVRTWTNQRHSYKWKKNTLITLKYKISLKSSYCLSPLLKNIKYILFSDFIYSKIEYFKCSDWHTWWSFIVPGTAERLLGVTLSIIVISDSWISNISTLVFHEMADIRDFALVMIPPLAIKASTTRSIAPPMPSAGPFQWPASRKFHEPDLKWKFSNNCVENK